MENRGSFICATSNGIFSKLFFDRFEVWILNHQKSQQRLLEKRQKVKDSSLNKIFLLNEYNEAICDAARLKFFYKL